MIGWYLSGYGAAVVSALIPVVNAELLLLSLIALTASRGGAVTMALIVTAGQVTGQGLLYWLARGVTTWRPSRLYGAAIDRWRARFEGAPRSLTGFLFVSATTGLPPFYAITVLSGTFRINFARYIIVALAGRAIRFVAIAFFPQLIHGAIKSL